MTLSVELFCSFRSPYSYLATARLAVIVRTYDVEVRPRHVYPQVMRKSALVAAGNPEWVKYVVRDAPRVADFLQVPFRWPKPDPLVQDMQTLRLAADQPYIRRLSCLGEAASERGRGMAFATEVFALLWGGGRGWNEGDHLARAAERAGLDLAEMDAAIATEPELFEEKMARNAADLEAAGHWGVPTMVFESEPFFGQDRIDVLLWRLLQTGLEPRREIVGLPPR